MIIARGENELGYIRCEEKNETRGNGGGMEEEEGGARIGDYSVAVIVKGESSRVTSRSR